MSNPTIKIEVDDGSLKLNFYDIFDAMTDEQKKSFMQHAVWQRDIFDDLIHAIINDHVVTKNYGFKTYEARKRILECIGTLEKNHFRSLMHELEQMRLDKERWENDYWKLYHSIPIEDKVKTPRHEERSHAKWNNDAEVEQEIVKRS